MEILTIKKTVIIYPNKHGVVKTDKIPTPGKVLVYFNTTKNIVTFKQGEKYLADNFKELALSCNGNFIKYNLNETEE